MKKNAKKEFVDAVETYGLGTVNNKELRATAHTSAVTTKDWKKIQEETKRKDH